MASNNAPWMPAPGRPGGADAAGPDTDGDPVAVHNGGPVLDVTMIGREGYAKSQDPTPDPDYEPMAAPNGPIPSLGTGAGISPGPCA